MDRNLLSDFGHKKRLLLEIDLATTLAGRIEFRRTYTIGVPATDEGCLASYFAHFCHREILRHLWIKRNVLARIP